MKHKQETKIRLFTLDSAVDFECHLPEIYSC